MQAVFDGHNDVLLRLWQNARKGSDPVGEFVTGTDKGHIDAPRAKTGGLIGGLCFLTGAIVGFYNIIMTIRMSRHGASADTADVPVSGQRDPVLVAGE